jgi:hypothetical protein
MLVTSLRDEVLAIIQRVETNIHVPHPPEEALQIAQIKALLLIAQVLEERLDALSYPDELWREGAQRGGLQYPRART